ncbi:Scr1 family TA system antitoxin-like transcriptional regulator [Kitasatospora sp. NPDC094011]|uniref:Scr1 family TA system antitoxin-like transcriptional regulator n=1 Tax=Kitasatospora sp. NPDC094011 TaxID=3364090 RepID=UPI00382A5032
MGFVRGRGEGRRVRRRLKHTTRTTEAPRPSSGEPPDRYRPRHQARAVLDESCIRRPIGGPVVMAAQFDRLLSFALLPHTLLQIAPFDIGEARAFDLPINIITKADRTLMSYAESAQQGNLERDSDAVQAMLTTYYQLQARALPQGASVALVSQLREELP